VALYDKADTLLAADKDIFEIPIQTCLTLPRGELSTWIKLVTPTVRRAIKDTNEHIRLTNNTILPHIGHQPDPMILNKQVNELCPVPRLHNNPTTKNNQTSKHSFGRNTLWLAKSVFAAITGYHRCRFPEGE
jgi:hypothetical protein